jgi:hypothetical protein
VALIRTDVSEDRIASIFRVYECEQAPFPAVPYGCIPHTIFYSKYRYLKPTPLTLDCLHAFRWRSFIRVVAYTRAYYFVLCLLALVHPEDGGDTILETSVLIRATRRHLPEDDNHYENFLL